MTKAYEKLREALEKEKPKPNKVASKPVGRNSKEDKEFVERMKR